MKLQSIINLFVGMPPNNKCKPIRD